MASEKQIASEVPIIGAAKVNAAPGRKSKRRFSKKYIVLFISIIAVMVIAAGIGAFALYNNKKNTDLNSLPDIEAMISRHYVLPNGETPALVTVTDKSKLTTPFLQVAENGDKLLIYQNSKKIIIYRPSIDRVIDSGPVSVVPLDQSTQ